MPNANQTAVPALRELALDRVAWSRRFLNALLADLKDEQLVARAGNSGNHAAWVMGHVSTVDDNIVSAMTGQPKRLPESFRTRFGMGSQPSERAADYPSRAELNDALVATRERLREWITTLDDSTAFQALPERMQRIAPNRIMLAAAVPSHEMMHAGQLTVVRAALGLPRLLQ
jgi:uncharacterized damage-inducible protein DinB